MKRFQIVLPFVLALSIVAVVIFAFNGTPALAQPNAQATSTPAAVATPAPASGDQTYVTLLPVASGADKLLVLKLHAGGKADLTTDPLGADPPVTEVGTWTASGSTVTVTLTGDGSKTLDKPVTLVFTQDSDKLTATEFDKTVYGDSLTLYLRDAIEDQITGMERAFVTLDLAAGFPLDPFVVSVNGGGELDASVLSADCHGYINDNPTVTVHWTGQADMVRAFTYSDADPTLVVQTPDGKFLCGDDASALALDAQIEISKPPAGTYNIWVGSAQAHQLLPTILVLTAHPDVTLENFQLSDLVKRPPVPQSGSTLPYDMQEKVVTDAIGRYKGTVGGPLGATPLTQQVSSAGSMAAFEIDFGGTECNGYITDTPNYVFDVSSAVDQFSVFFESKQDAALLVVGPDGQVQCNDDSVAGSNANPSVTLTQPKEGRYAVFVGRLNEDAAVDGTVTVTTDPKAKPQTLPPSK